ncbi:hypothetical protein WJX84_002360 [Apatococcus fuscideae]|uniref:Acyl-coenzyme A oxidase n=1 Tax=Apatococcus fuscideae TaxID=2026836 RepID=A0AAW1SMY7_9CHLO
MVDERTRNLVKASSRLVLAEHVDPQDDMRAERARASFASENLAEYLNGGKAILERRSRLVAQLEKTTWGDKSQRYFLTREQEYVEGLKAAMGIWQLMQSGRLSVEDGLEMRNLLSFPGGLELHIGMFMPSIMSQGDEEQQAYWLPLAQTLKVIGTYAQTELGHGTFVRGLETTATYDAQSEQFVVHSPALSSTKWWPGGLGKTSTHIILMARLIIDAKDYGLHAFVMQIRDLRTHLPVQGVTVGDIGPKFGYNGVDNGFLIFDHAQIPRKAMLMRYAKVTSEGKYVPPPAANAKASYATMVYVRATIVEDAGWYLAKAATIAVRYNAIRRQTAAKVGEKELQVLDYQNTSATLLPLVAVAYALIFMGKSAMKMYKQFEKARNKGDFSLLPELHAVLSGMKAVSTWTAADGIEACRRGCGGHGFSALSGLPNMFASYVQNVTWEGDNNVLCLQTARHLLKSCEAAGSGKQVPGSAAYLTDAQQEITRKCSVGSHLDWRHSETLVTALRHRAARLAVEGHELLIHRGNGTLHFEGPAWNGSTVHLIHMARAHSQLVLHQTFTQAAQEAQVDQAAQSVLQRLVSLHGLTILIRELGDFLIDGYLTPAQAKMLQGQQNELLLELRPDAVALVDGFGFEDYQLNSCLGRSDGNVYHALLQAARSSPLNKTEEGPAWHGVLKNWLDPESRQQTHSRL